MLVRIWAGYGAVGLDLLEQVLYIAAKVMHFCRLSGYSHMGSGWTDHSLHSLDLNSHSCGNKVIYKQYINGYCKQSINTCNKSVVIVTFPVKTTGICKHLDCPIQSIIKQNLQLKNLNKENIITLMKMTPGDVVIPIKNNDC